MTKRVIPRVLIEKRWHTKLSEMGGYNPTQGLCRNLGLVAAELLTTSISRGKKISFKNPAEGLVELSSLIGTVTFGGRS